MSHVLTLIAPRGSQDLLAKILGEVRTALGTGHDPFWLSPGEACDLTFTPVDPAAIDDVRGLVAHLGAGFPLDAAVQPVEERRKRLLVADMDSTIIRQECLDEIAALAGVKPQIAAITERAMRGELNFEAALTERIGLLRGFPLSKLQEVLEERITLTPGARTLTATMRANGGRCVLVSGGFTFFTGAVALMAGFDAHHGNSFLVEDDAIVGVAEPILGQDAKLAALNAGAAGMGIAADEAIAVGDGANDLAMLKAAGLGVAFHAKPVVAREAAARIDHGDLTSLLFLQGYSRQDFVDRQDFLDHQDFMDHL
jgi:phosphoserine phosphatase